MAGAVTGDASAEEAGEVALGFGLSYALLSMTTALAQVERGLNGFYGIRRDRRGRQVRPGRRHDCGARRSAGLGFLVLVAGGAFADQMVATYGCSEGAVALWNVTRDFDQQAGGAEGSDARQFHQGGSGRCDELLVGRLLAGVNPLDVPEQFATTRRRALPATSRGRILREHDLAGERRRQAQHPAGAGRS